MAGSDSSGPGFFERIPIGLRLVLEWAAGLAAWFGGFDLIKHFIASWDARNAAANIYVVVSAVALAVAWGVREYLVNRKERYANVTSYCHHIAHITRDLNTYIENHEPQGADRRELDQFLDVCNTKFGEVLDELTNIFISLTSTRCRASIKLIYRYNDQAYYSTLVRDKGSAEACRELDTLRAERNHDPLIKNKQFAVLFDDSSGRRSYFCNDLTLAPEFTSTSFTAYDPEWGQTGLQEKKAKWGKAKLRNWPLPYRSTICCVIRHGPANFISDMKPLVLGFVTIDSESRGVFDERWDPPFLFMAADGLFHPLRKMLEIQNKVLGRPHAHLAIGTKPALDA